MQQQIKTELENWLLSNQDDFTRLFDLNISEKQILAATKNKYLLLSTALKQEYDLGVIIKFPSLTGLTEVNITTQPKNQKTTKIEKN